MEPVPPAPLHFPAVKRVLPSNRILARASLTSWRRSRFALATWASELCSTSSPTFNEAKHKFLWTLRASGGFSNLGIIFPFSPLKTHLPRWSDRAWKASRMMAKRSSESLWSTSTNMTLQKHFWSWYSKLDSLVGMGWPCVLSKKKAT